MFLLPFCQFFWVCSYRSVFFPSSLGLFSQGLMTIFSVLFGQLLLFSLYLLQFGGLLFPLGFDTAVYICTKLFYIAGLFSTQRSFFSIYCKAGLVVLNSFSFCLSVKLLISMSNLKESLTGYSYLQVLPFHHFEYIMPLASGLQSFS